jgi:hypothetical protein
VGVEDGGRDMKTVDKLQVRGREEGHAHGIPKLSRAVQHDRRWHGCNRR